MDFAFVPLSISTRRKLTSILLEVVIFAALAGLATSANGRPVAFGVLNAQGNNPRQMELGLRVSF